MRGTLFNDLTVALDPRTALLGGSFEGATAYAPEPLTWAYQYLSPRVGPVLIDVGASTGSYSLLAAHLRSLKVIAFEGAALTYDVLAENIRLNDLADQVKAVHAAVSDYDGPGEFQVCDPPAMIALSQLGGAPHHTKVMHAEKVAVTRLDSYLAAHPMSGIDLIKIDVEGAELMVLRGAERTIRERHPALLVEVNQQNTLAFGYEPEAIIELLSAWGYDIRAIGGVDICAIYRGETWI